MTPNDNIKLIIERQKLLESAVTDAQRKLYEMLLEDIEKNYDSPSKIILIFKKFKALVNDAIIVQFVKDINSIVDINESYFTDFLDISRPKVVGATNEAKLFLQDRFGVNFETGEIVKNSYLDTFIADDSVLNDIRKFTFRSRTADIGYSKYRKGLAKLINGSNGNAGILERHYQTFAYDTYQQTDRVIHKQVSEKLGLRKYLYIGGEMATTRPFCHSRTGKVFTSDEIKSWANLNFQGKSNPYDPFINCGGYNCRHHLRAVTDSYK